MLLHREYGAGLRLRPEQGESMYKTAAYAALASVHAQETRSEQMRLLYVALTRAQDKLILTVPLGMTKTGNPFAKAAAFLAAGAGETLNQQAGSFADWLRAALLVHPFGGPLRRLAGDLELPFVFTESEIMVTVQEAQPEPETPEQEPEAAEPVPADPALVAQLQEGFAWRYPAAKLAAVPAKVSVTSIVHKAEQTTLERPAFLSRDGLTAAEMGTAPARFSGTCGLCLPCCCQRRRARWRKPSWPSASGRWTPAGGPGDRGKTQCRPHPPLCRERSLCKDLRSRKGAAGAGLHHGAARVEPC